jgi:hypothetical protein
MPTLYLLLSQEGAPAACQLVPACIQCIDESGFRNLQLLILGSGAAAKRARQDEAGCNAEPGREPHSVSNRDVKRRNANRSSSWQENY